MAVRIVTDSSSGLTPAEAKKWGITVLPLHTMVGTASHSTTSGLTALELCAAYARQLERGGDRGVLALHLPKELSATWSAAAEAAAVFGASVQVVDTSTVGFGVGAAALAAARVAAAGGDLRACHEAATRVFDREATWLYVHRIDELRRSGRLPTSTVVLSAALATKPLLRIVDGRLDVAFKARTRTRAFERLVETVAGYLGESPATVVLQGYQSREASRRLADMLEEALPSGVMIELRELDAALATHTGPGAIGVTVILGEEAGEPFRPDPA